MSFRGAWARCPRDSRRDAGATAPRSTDSGHLSRLRDECLIAVGTPVAEELPRVAHFRDHVEVEIGDHDFIFVAAGLRDDFAPWIAEITLAIEFAYVPRRFFPYPIQCSHKVSIGYGVRWLFKLPKIFGKTRDGRRRIKDNFGAVQSQAACSFGKMAVVADVHSNLGVLCIEDSVVGISRREIELLPEARRHLWNVVLAIFTEILAIGINDSRRVVVEAGHLHFIYRDDHHHVVFRCNLLHQLDRRAVRYTLSQSVPACILLGTEIWTIKDFLQTKDLNLLPGCLINQLQVLVEHGLLDFFERILRTKRIAGLDQPTADGSGHLHLAG